MVFNLLKYWMDMTQAGMDAAVTIDARMRRMVNGSVTGDIVSDPEMQRMAEEKLQATTDGAIAATTAAMDVISRAPLTPHGWAGGYLEVLKAATAPAFRTVGRNARRLGKSRDD